MTYIPAKARFFVPDEKKVLTPQASTAPAQRLQNPDPFDHLRPPRVSFRREFLMRFTCNPIQILQCALAIAVTLSATACSKSSLNQDQMKAAARDHADKCAQAVIREDFDQLVKYMYPKAVEKIGGKEKVIAVIQQTKKLGMTPKAASIGEIPEIKESHGQQFAAVPETIEFSTAGGSLRMESTMLGISDDGGRNWTFIDSAGSPANAKLIHELVPNLPSDLMLSSPKFLDPSK
jgi:hypothetical protein